MNIQVNTKAGFRSRFSLPSELHAGSVFGRAEVELAKVAFFDVVEDVLNDSEGRTFALKLENNHATVVT